MSKQLKKTASHAGIYAVGVVLNRAVSFFMLPIYTRFLSTADYGALELLEVTVDVVSIFTGMGVLQGLYKFYYEYEDDDERKEIVSTVFLMIIMGYVATCGVGSALSSTISDLVFGTPTHASWVALSFVNLLLSFLIYVPLSYLQARQRPIFFVVVSSVKLVLQLTLNIVLVVGLGMKVTGVLYSTLISTAIIGGWLTIYTFGDVGLRFSWEKARRLFLFGYPFVAMGLAAFVTTFSDRYFLNYYHGVAVVGVYSLAYKFGFLLMMFPVRPIFNIWMVQRFELVREAGYEEVFNRFLNWFTLITLGVAVFVSLAVRDVLRVMSDSEFWGAFQVVPLVLLAYFFQACTDFFNFGIYHSGKTRQMAYATVVAAAVIVALSFLLIPSYGMFGAAWATVVSFFVRLAWVYVASQRLFRVNYRLARPLTATAVGALLVLGYLAARGQFPRLDEPLPSVALSTGLLLLYPALLMLLNVIDAGERRFFLDALRSPRRAFARLREQG